MSTAHIKNYKNLLGIIILPFLLNCFLCVGLSKAEVCFLPDDKGCSIVPVIQQECTGSKCNPTPTCGTNCFAKERDVINKRITDGFDSYYKSGNCYCLKNSCSGTYIEKTDSNQVCTGLCEDKNSVNDGKYRTCTGDDSCCPEGYSTTEPTITQHCYDTHKSTSCDKTCYKILDDPDCEKGELLSYDNSGGCTCVKDYVFTFADGTTEDKSITSIVPNSLGEEYGEGYCGADVISKLGDNNVEFSVMASGRTLVGTHYPDGYYENNDKFLIAWDTTGLGVYFDVDGMVLQGSETYTLVQNKSNKTLTLTCTGVCNHDANFTELGNQCVCKDSYKRSGDLCYCDTDNGFIEEDGKCTCNTAEHFIDKNGECVCDESKNFVFNAETKKCVCKTGYELSSDGKSCEFKAKCDDGLTIEDNCPEEEHYLYAKLFHTVNTIETDGVEKRCGYCVDCNSVVPPTHWIGVPTDRKQCWSYGDDLPRDVCGNDIHEYIPLVTADSTFYSCGQFGGLFNSPEPCTRFGSAVWTAHLKRSWTGRHDPYKVSAALSDYELDDYDEEVEPFAAYFDTRYQGKELKDFGTWGDMCTYINPSSTAPVVWQGEEVKFPTICRDYNDATCNNLARGLSGRFDDKYKSFVESGQCENGTTIDVLQPAKLFHAERKLTAEEKASNSYVFYAYPPVASGSYTYQTTYYSESGYDNVYSTWDWNFELCPLPIENEYVTCLTAEYVIDDDPLYSVRNHNEGRRKITVVGDTSFIDVKLKNGEDGRYFKYRGVGPDKTVYIDLNEVAGPSSGSRLIIYKNSYDKDASYKAYDEFLRYEKHIAAPNKLGAAIKMADAKYVVGNVFIPKTVDSFIELSYDYYGRPLNEHQGFCKIGSCPAGSVIENSCRGTFFTPNGAYLLPEGARGYTDNVLDLIPCGTCTEGCDESNHFIEDSNGGCVCDAANHYVIQKDGTCDCDYPYIKDEEGNCVCEFENEDGTCGCAAGYEPDADGNCVEKKSLCVEFAYSCNGGVCSDDVINATKMEAKIDNNSIAQLSKIDYKKYCWDIKAIVDYLSINETAEIGIDIYKGSNKYNGDLDLNIFYHSTANEIDYRFGNAYVNKVIFATDPVNSSGLDGSEYAKRYFTILSSDKSHTYNYNIDLTQ